ncbi:SRPBCC family protein [Pseudonocardia xishanensis]|uniref:SRPBCC family protein n=1 Tax=Pseudonocardia xishanensis TaxID=630995 RepID=A0ABP8S1Y8_9PSEU
MVAVQRVVRTRTPLESVVSYLADFSHAEQWDPGTKSCERLDSGPLGEGSTWRNVSVFRGNETELTYTLVTRTADRLVFRGENRTVTSTDDLQFTAVGGGTEITYAANLDFHGVAKLAAPFLKAEFERLGDEVERTLPAVLDGLS